MQYPRKSTANARESTAIAFWHPGATFGKHVMPILGKFKENESLDGSLFFELPEEKEHRLVYMTFPDNGTCQWNEYTDKILGGPDVICKWFLQIETELKFQSRSQRFEIWCKFHPKKNVIYETDSAEIAVDDNGMPMEDEHGNYIIK